jgi:hypothetical protein
MNEHDDQELLTKYLIFKIHEFYYMQITLNFFKKRLQYPIPGKRWQINGHGE